MKKNRIFSNQKAKYFLLLSGGIFLGWLLFHPAKEKISHENMTGIGENTSDTTEIWTCAMHPQIRMHEPGKCPICGMDLIPLSKSGPAADPGAVHLNKEAVELANVLTTTVSRQKSIKEIRLYGKVQADERLLQNLVAHVPGRIERLGVNFTGETVTTGQVLAEIYSPELITAQQELLETVKTKQIQPEFYEASKEKLRQWKLTDEQIASIESSGKIIDNFKVLSTSSGTVTARRVNTGDHVSEGTVLFEIADLSKIWIVFDAYESDLQFISKGRKISFMVQALPGSNFTGAISFIDPVIDPVTRVARVRVEADNRAEKLKPEMFVTGFLSSDLADYPNSIVIPRSAVLWTGKRSIVYIKDPGMESIFRMREVELGPSLGESYVVTSGLTEGEEIVTSGTFSVDASAQLQGKPSMMNPEGGATNTMPGMDMPGTNIQKTVRSPGKNEMKDMNGNEMPDSSSSVKNVSMNFIMELNAVYDTYIQLKNDFVESDSEKAKKAAADFIDELKKANGNVLSGDARTKWLEISADMLNNLKTISVSDVIEEQRQEFSALSLMLYNAIKIFGLMNKTAYYQFCPMANNGKGAYWLSELNEIRNPYYGESMLSCGENRETLKF